ncbi:MAG TPA: penicillin-binding protein [Vicinamibacterales bacterium]|nr:penicillin-binding protein [Vicinamibacterales bacterium]
MADQNSADWRRTLKRRIVLLAVVLGLWAAGIEARLVVLQVLEHTELLARAQRQQMQTLKPPAERGDIIDRHGHVLACSVDADSVYAVPTEIKDPVLVAGELCHALDGCTADERQTLAKGLAQPRAFMYVRRQVSPEEVQRVRALHLDGVGFLKESRRFYPNRDLAAHVLGYVGLDNVGLAGVEAVYDSQIRGRSGRVLIQTDARRHALHSRVERAPTTGATLELTIDEYLQYIAERELRRGVEENDALGGTAIIMNPRTGEILAMANVPTFNPNTFQEASAVDRRNRAVQDVYEPGSTFKIVTASAALESGIWSVNDMIDTSPGTIRIGSRVIHDTEDHGIVSFSNFIIESSNVAAVKIATKVGAARLGQYVHRYGFGQVLSPDFPGQSAGIVWNPADWSEDALASVAFGYQIGVTPLQMVTAMSVIANGGLLMEPRVVRAFYVDGHRIPVPHRVIRRVITPQIAATLTNILNGVVEDDNGTARAARIPGYMIAGKTGTAAKLIDGRYSKEFYHASFVGFLPSNHPVVAILVVVDSPRAHGYYGGTVSAPIFKRIAEAVLQYYGIAPTINPTPPILVTKAAAAQPPAGPPPADRVVEVAARSDSSSAVPDLRGLSARDALQELARVGMTATLEGNGVVVDQDPAPGARIEPGAACRLTLKRVPVAVATAGAQP